MKNTLLRALAALAIITGCRAADTSISALPAISSVTSTTLVPVVDTSGTPTTKKANVSQLIAGLPAATGSSDGKMLAADKAKLDAAVATNTNSAIVRRDSSGNFAAGTITAALVTGLGSPTNPSDATNKAYVDAAAAGLTIKTPGVAGTVGSNITLAGGTPTTLDGVTLHANDRVLVKDQTDNKENGIYYVQTLGSGSNGTWVRTTDADTGAELITGSYIFLTGGTVNANAAYTMVTPGTIVIGTSAIVWNLFSQVTQIQAANILGQIVGSQIQDAAINTAKFAAGLTPVEILGTLPVSANFTGRQVLLTTDGKLYRYISGAFTSSEAAADITGTITTTQIADNSISTAKLQANSVTATNIAASAITAGKIAASAVTAGTIAAGAVSTTELAAGAVNASKIAAGTITATEIASNAITAAKILAGTITADKLTISSLSAISANIGTVTAGTLSAVTINSATLNTPNGNIGGFTIDPFTFTSTTGNYLFYLQAASGGIPGEINMQYSSNILVYLTESTAGGRLALGKIGTFNNIDLIGQTGIISTGGAGGVQLNGATGAISSNGRYQKMAADDWGPLMWDGSNTVEFRWDSGALQVRIDGSTVLTVDTH